MKLPEPHRRLLTDALDAAGEYELAPAGGYAVQAHGLVSRPSQDLVVDLEDLVVMKVHALGERGLPRDVIDVHVACHYYSVIELEQLGLRDGTEFELAELRDRLESVVWVSDEEFGAYGLGPEEIAELRQWALEWESDLGLRLAEEYDDPDDGLGHPEERG